MIQPKRINKEHLFLTTSAAVCLAFMAFAAIVFPAFKVANLTIPAVEETIKYNVLGTNAIFGGKIVTAQGFTIGEFNFSLLSLIAYLLPLASVVVSVLAFKKNGPLLNYVAAILAFGGAVMMFFQLSFIKFEPIANLNVEFKLFVGPILGSIFSALAGCFNLGCTSIKNIK